MKEFKKDSLDTHNEFRERHGAPTMKWSSKLQTNAQKWAEALAKKGYLQHDDQKTEGENIACMKGQDLTGRKATEMWYDEIKDYNFKKPGFNSKTGHFTQVVWADSVELGVGKATAPSGMQFVVARYFPPGNNLARFPDNVKSPGSKPVKRPDAGKPAPSRAAASSDTGREKPQTGKGFQDDILKSHNYCRKQHSSPGLKWSSKLAAEAQKAADEAAKTNTLKPVSLNNVGQNMAAMTGGELTGKRVTEMWYEEEKNYDYKRAGFHSSTGSFTQMIWAGSTTFAAAKAIGKQGQQFVVALYEPPGNVRGQYESNVKSNDKTKSGKGDGDKDCCIM
eukprot:gene3339-3828_t